MQWIAIFMTTVSLFLTSYYNHRTLKVAQIENELISHLNLSERYHRILYSLLESDSHVFQRTDRASLEKNQYLIYEAIDLFCTVHSLEKYHEEMVKDIWPQWRMRMEFFFDKPAVRFAWRSQAPIAHQIYNQKFISHVCQLVADESQADFIECGVEDVALEAVV